MSFSVFSVSLWFKIMKLLIATSNPHKLEEIREIITDESIELLSPTDLPERIDEPVEDGETFEANAELKARYYAKAAGMLCLADDSGLEVDALNGEPGVRSARYSNTDGPRADRDRANCRFLLKNLADTPTEERATRFVCAMALADGREDKDETIAVVRGMLEGRILLPEEADDPSQSELGRGNNGFGYDPLVYVPDRNKTVAELTSAEKNAISHRGNALKKMWLHIYIEFSDQIKYEAGEMPATRELFRDFIQDFMAAAITDREKARAIIRAFPKLKSTPVTLGESPLHYLAIEGQAEAVEFLIQEGFDVDTKNDFGDTPLIDVASIGETKTAEVLLRHGADPNAKSGLDDSVLFCAIRSGDPKLVELVLKYGASVDYINDMDEDIFDITREAKDNSQEIGQVLRNAVESKSHQ